MKYGSIYSKDNIENKYNYSSTGGRRSSQNNFETSPTIIHIPLNTDGLLEVLPVQDIIPLVLL